MNRRPKGFTLTEVLMVLVVVTMLAVVLFAVLSRVRESERRSVCQSNLHQIGLALQSYVQDYNGRFPLMSGRRYWNENAAAYIKDANILYCPSQKRRPTLIPPKDTTYWYNANRTTTYTDRVFNIKNQSGTHEATITQPEYFILVRDKFHPEYYPEKFVKVPESCQIGAGVSGSTIHSGGGNNLFFDGHVKWLLPEKVAEIECKAGPYNMDTPKD